LVLDLRFNPGGRLDEAVAAANLFLESGRIVSVRGRSRPEQSFDATSAGTFPDFPLAVLVNEHSASAAEILAGALADHRRATIVGARTYGKGSVQEVEPMGDDGILKITTAYYYLPSGRLVNRKPEATDWGVNPDVNVPLDEDGMRNVLQGWAEQMLIRSKSSLATRPSQPAGTDVQLDKAVQTLAMIMMVGKKE